MALLSEKNICYNNIAISMCAVYYKGGHNIACDYEYKVTNLSKDWIPKLGTTLINQIYFRAWAKLGSWVGEQYMNLGTKNWEYDIRKVMRGLKHTKDVLWLMTQRLYIWW